MSTATMESTAQRMSITDVQFDDGVLKWKVEEEDDCLVAPNTAGIEVDGVCHFFIDRDDEKFTVGGEPILIGSENPIEFGSAIEAAKWCEERNAALLKLKSPAEFIPPTPIREWKTHCTFYATGKVKGQPRPRAFARMIGNKAVARVHDAGTAEAWKGDIARAAEIYRPQSPLEGPIRVDVDFFFERPQRLMRKSDPTGAIPHVSKPDRDNCDKAVLDCLTVLGFFKDEQVCAGEPSKWYVPIGCTPGAMIRISTLELAPGRGAD